MKRLTITWLIRMSALLLACAGTLGTSVANAGVSGAIYTTTSDGKAVNGNIYGACCDVYLNGGPQNFHDAGLQPGTYYFQVTIPGWHPAMGADGLLSLDAASCRQVTVGLVDDGNGNVHGVITGPTGTCQHQAGQLNPENGSTPVQLCQFSPTPNPGNEYKVWLIPVDAPGVSISPDDDHVIIFDESVSKTDNFKCTDGTTTRGTDISGVKFHDIDGNGVWDKDTEEGLDGWTIHIIWTDKDGNAHDDTTPTGTFGVWGWVVPTDAQSVTVCEEIQSGWQETAPTEGDKNNTTSPGANANASRCWELIMPLTPAPVDDINFGNLETAPLTVTKDAAGSYDNKYTWTIDKSVDKTLVEQAGGSATFNYTVTVTHDSGTVSNVKVNGTITIFNPNTFTVPVTISDALSDSTSCVNGQSLDAVTGNNTYPYECDLSSLPQGQEDNTVTITWGDVKSGTYSLPGGTANFTFSAIAFTKNDVDECVDVTDSYAGDLGNVCVGDSNPKSFTYQRSITVPAYNCAKYDNTATFTANDTGATGSDSQTVEVCGPAKTGALTMGFWQNKNGQGIITGGASVSGVCKSGTWLRQYAPFQDLSATASCSQVATYVYNIIKAANASGSSMNAMLKAQMLATALDVYFSDPTLGGNKINAPAPIGAVTIDLTKICKMIDGSGGTGTCGGTYENVSSAFGGATSLTVSQMLTYAASQSNAGGTAWYGQVKATQGLAKDAFDAINNGVAFSP